MSQGEHFVDPRWGEYPAEEWSDAIVASMKLGGVDRLYFVSGTEIAYVRPRHGGTQQHSSRMRKNRLVGAYGA